MRSGDEVTVIPVDDDPYILQFQRNVTVSLVVGDSAYVKVQHSYPPGQEFGPIPAARLLPGWRDKKGAFRKW